MKNVDAFTEGYEAEKAAKSFLDNPYLSDPLYLVEARRWVDGYVKAIQAERYAGSVPQKGFDHGRSTA